MKFTNVESITIITFQIDILEWANQNITEYQSLVENLYNFNCHFLKQGCYIILY